MTTRRTPPRDNKVDPALIASRDRLIILHHKRELSLGESSRRLRKNPLYRDIANSVLTVKRVRQRHGLHEPDGQVAREHERRVKLRDQIIVLANSMTAKEIAKELKISQSSVRKYVEDVKPPVEFAKKKDATPDVDQIIKDYYTLDKLTNKQIAAKLEKHHNLKRSTSWVRSRVAKMGCGRSRAESTRLVNKKRGRGPHKRLQDDLSPETLARIKEMYDSGIGTTKISRELGLNFCNSAVQNICKRMGCKIRSPREAAKTADRKVKKMFKPGEAVELEIVKQYETGTSLNRLANNYGVTPAVIRRILTEHHVRVRGHTESHKLRSDRLRAAKDSTRLRSARERILASREEIENTMRALYFTRHAGKFQRLQVSDVVAASMSYADAVAARFDDTLNDSFVTYVAYYAMLRYYDAIRPPRSQRRGQGVRIVSMDAPLGESDRGQPFCMHDTVGQPDDALGLHDDTDTWDLTKAKLKREARLMVKAGQLSEHAYVLLTEYYIPLVEDESTAPPMRDVAKRRGISQSRMSQIAHEENFKYLIEQVIKDVAA